MKWATNVDLLALGGEDELTPLADAVKSCQIEVAKKLIGHIIETGNNNLLKTLAIRKTKSGKDLYQLAKDTKNESIIDLVEKLKIAINSKNYKNVYQMCVDTDASGGVQASNNQKMSVQNSSDNSNDDTNLYWTASFVYFYKYTATYRLHFTKLLMNMLRFEKNPLIKCKISENLASLNGEKSGMKFRDKRESIQSSLLAQFSFERSPDTIATDIRTFWKLCKQIPSSNPALSSVVLN